MALVIISGPNLVESVISFNFRLMGVNYNLAVASQQDYLLVNTDVMIKINITNTDGVARDVAMYYWINRSDGTGYWRSSETI